MIEKNENINLVRGLVCYFCYCSQNSLEIIYE